MSMLSSDPRSLSYDVYTYLYPLVTMEVTRRQGINVEADAKPGFGPPNAFHHIRAFPPADFRAVVRPNFDTLYSSASLDLRSGPVVVHAPDTDDRYYMLPMLDMWTDVLASPGKRTTGTGAQGYVVVGPGYTGQLPAGKPVIQATTPWLWVIGRTQTNGPGDYAAVHAVQDGYTITPLDPAEYHIDPDVDTTTEPLRLVNEMSAVEFFTYACEALMVNDPHASDFSVLSRIANLGIVPGQRFDPGGFDSRALEEIEAGATAARKTIAGNVANIGAHANGWALATDTVGVYGNAYLKRATIALGGLGANPPEDAVYPVLLADSDGDLIHGDQNYLIRFDAADLPPVDAFWSITMYDSEGFQTANELNRFAIGDAIRSPTTQTGRSTSSSNTRAPAPTTRRTGYPHRAAHSGSRCACTRPGRRCSTGPGRPPAVEKR
jgi:hypothetical protein